MYTRSTFGSYYPVDSVIHNLNPIIKLVNFLLIVLLLILTKSLYVVLFITMLLIIMILQSRVPLHNYFSIFYSLRYIYLLLAFICSYFGLSFNEYLVYLLKIVIFFEYISILSYTTSPSETIYSIEKFLSLFNIFYLNVNSFAFRLNNMLRYYPLYQSVKYNLYISSSQRGIVYNTLSIPKRISLHFNTKRLSRLKSKQIMKENELKQYNVSKYRTNLRTNKVSFNDIFFLIFHLMLMYSYLIEGGLI